MLDTKAMFAAALKHHQAGALDLAEAGYRELLEQEAGHADATHLLGVVALQRGQTATAIETISRAIALQPGTAEYHNNLAAAYRSHGSLDLAIEHYGRALEIRPGYADAHNNLGNVLREHGRNGDGEASYRRALKIDPKFMTARANLNRSQGDEPTSRLHLNDGGKPEHDADTQIVLHVGCGPANSESLHKRFRDGKWTELRLDIDPNVQPDIVASLTDMQAVAGDSVNAVWSSHNLEHLYSHDVPVALAEFHRVLKPGGFALVTMPDLQQIAEFVVADKLEDVAYESPAGPIAPLDCIYGLRSSVASGNAFMAHRTGFTASTLKRHLSRGGFVDVKVWFSPFALWAEAHKPRRAA